MSTHELSERQSPDQHGLPNRKVLRDEVVLVLALSLAASALYAIVDILSAPIRGVEAPLFADVGLIYQLLNLATSLVPVVLVLHFLGRSGESAASIGLDASRPWSDLRWGVGLSRQSVQHLNGTYRNIAMATSGRRAVELEYDLLRLLQPVL